jgi:hypothetical protein
MKIGSFLLIWIILEKCRCKHPLLFRLLYFPDLHPGTIGEEKKILKAGDGYYVAPNLLHGCVCLEAGVLIDTFTPMREDFLK